jgi:hypothetical protein
MTKTNEEIREDILESDQDPHGTLIYSTPDCEACMQAARADELSRVREIVEKLPTRDMMGIRNFAEDVIRILLEEIK